MRTDRKRKVAIFAQWIHVDNAPEAMRAYATLFGEAAEWIRGELVRKVPISATKTGYHYLYNLSVNLDHELDHDENGMEIRLYAHYDDNEKG